MPSKLHIEVMHCTCVGARRRCQFRVDCICMFQCLYSPLHLHTKRYRFEEKKKCNRSIHLHILNCATVWLRCLCWPNKMRKKKLFRITHQRTKSFQEKKRKKKRTENNERKKKTPNRTEEKKKLFVEDG